jgi:hypothetical protein
METARAVIDELFEHPPVSDAELSQRLSAANADDSRRLLMERLQSSLGEEELGLFIAVFKKLGIGPERERLMQLAVDKGVETFVRTLAIAVLAEDDPEMLNAGIKDLDPDDIVQLADHPIMELLSGIESIPTYAKEITAFLLDTPAQMRPFLLNRIGLCRKKVGVSAAAVYSHALACDDLAELHEGMISAIVEEGGLDAIELLQRLRDQTANRETRGRLHAALMRLSTRAIDPKRDERAPVAGSAYVGSCDGQGAFIIVSVFKKPNGSLTAADLCIRAAADVRDGFVVTRQSQKEVKSLLQRAKDSSCADFASVSLEQAAWVVAEALERTAALKVAIPTDAIPAVNLLRPLFTQGLKAKPTVEPAKKTTVAQVKRLLARPVYQYWFFEIPALVSAGVNPPRQDKAPSDRWLESAARKLDKEPLRGRVVAMARHMAYWHTWRGENELAGQCEAMALETERDFTHSPLVRVMLERTLTADLSEEEPVMEMLGAPEIRQYLKSLFFSELHAPTGKEMALLDLTEVAMVNLDQALACLTGERRPREDQKPEIAFAIANRYWELLSGRREVRVDEHMEGTLKEFVKKYGFKKREALELVAEIAFSLAQFTEEVCSVCEVDCFERPTADTSEVFFSPHHPMALYDDCDAEEQEQLEMDELWSNDDN